MITSFTSFIVWKFSLPKNTLFIFFFINGLVNKLNKNRFYIPFTFSIECLAYGDSTFLNDTYYTMFNPFAI